MSGFDRRSRWCVPLVLLLLAAFPLLAAAEEAAGDAIARIQASLDAQEWDDAIAAARGVLAQDVDDAEARTRLARALMGKARSEEKIPDAVQMERLKTAQDPAAFFSPDLFKTEVKYEDALLAEAEAEFRAVLNRNRPPLDAYIGLATLYVESDRFPEELEVIGSAGARFPGDADALARLLSFGEHHFRASDYDRALEVFRSLDRSFPATPALALDISAALFATGKYAEGVRSLEAAVDANPGHGNMYRTLGQMYLFRQEWAKAAEMFRRLLSHEPDDRMFVVYRGAALMPVDVDGAATVFEQLLLAEDAPRDQVWVVARNLHTALTTPGIEAEHLVSLAADLTRMSMPELATAVSGLVLSRDAGNVQARMMLAAIYDRMKYYDMALAELEVAKKLLAAAPEEESEISPEALSAHLGRVHFHREEYRAAVAAFLATGEPERFAFAMALSYEGLGEYGRAYDYFQRVLQDGANLPQVEVAREHLVRDAYAKFRDKP